MSNCSCIYVNEFDESSFYKEEDILAARKCYVCCECGRKINVGDRYKKSVIKWNGEFRTFKTCVDCVSIINEFFCNGWHFGMVFEDLRAYMESGGEISEECLLGLTNDARYKVFDMIEEGWLNDN